MMARNISYHIAEDRLDRAILIMTTIGLGNIVKEQKAINASGRPCWECITDTGVIIVLDEPKKVAITLYIASMPKVSAIYKGQTPGWLIKVVKKNKELAKMQNEVRC